MGSSTVIVLFILVTIFAILVLLTGRRRNKETRRVSHIPHGNTSLYDQLGGIYNIAAVIDRFSDKLLTNPLVGVNSPNPQLADWSRQNMGADSHRLAGLKWMRTLWVADVTGGPFQFHGSQSQKGGSRCPFTHSGASGSAVNLDLTRAHCALKITGPEFDAVAQELAQTMIEFQVPTALQKQILDAFGAHKTEVTAGSR